MEITLGHKYRWHATTIYYDSLHTDVDIQRTANAIVDVCQDRDNQRYDVFTRSDINDI